MHGEHFITPAALLHCTTKGDREKNNTAIDQCQKEELESIRDATLDEVISYIAKAKYNNPGEPGNRRDVQIDKTARYLQS